MSHIEAVLIQIFNVLAVFWTVLIELMVVAAIVGRF